MPQGENMVFDDTRNKHETSGISVILAPTLELAQNFATMYNPEFTIECEYGATVIEGTTFTGAHHQVKGPYARDKNPSPCNNPNAPLASPGSTFLVSHMDLDTIGGIMRTLEEYKYLFEGEDNKNFWTFAEYIDLNGSHKADLYPNFKNIPEEEAIQLKNLLHAYWGWRDHNPMSCKNDCTNIITPFFRRAAKAIKEVLAKNPKYLSIGEIFRVKNVQLNTESYWFSREIHNQEENDPFRVFFRKSCTSVNHLYHHPRDETVTDAIVAWNPKTGSITLSYFDDTTADTVGPAYDVMQTIWGPDAGGHPGIAGTPRSIYYQQEETDKVYSELVYRFMILSAITDNIPF